MQEIDVLIDTHPDLASELIQLDIRNQQAHKELQSFNDSGEFLSVHPLCRLRKFEAKQYTDLSSLKYENPELFLNEITNTIQNARRIESNIRNKKYRSKEELLSWSENLEKAKLRITILKRLLNS